LQFDHFEFRQDEERGSYASLGLWIRLEKPWAVWDGREFGTHNANSSCSLVIRYDGPTWGWNKQFIFYRIPKHGI